MLAVSSAIFVWSRNANITNDIRNKIINSIVYQFKNYSRNYHDNGYHTSILPTLNFKGWQFHNQFIITNFKTLNATGYFLRPTLDMSKELARLWGMRLGASYALEQNQTKNKLTDTLDLNSFSFDTYSIYLQSNQRKKNKYGIIFFIRNYKYPFYICFF